LPEVLKQGQEHLLDDFLSIRKGQTEARQIPHQRVPELIEESDDLLLQLPPAIVESGSRGMNWHR
jgi:hypothetical protein